MLYLEAEAAGVRGTGVGSFFDDPVREVFGVETEPADARRHPETAGARP